MIVAPTLTDGIVTLRAHCENDIPSCLEQSNDQLSQRWTRVPVPYSLEDARRFIRHAMPGGWESDSEWAFAVEAVDPDGSSRYAGTVSLRNIGPGRAEIAYGAHPWARGRGIVERALRLLLDWGFAERDLETVIWMAESGNWASRRIAWRLGFSCDATLRRWMSTRDRLVDGWVGVLTHEDARLPRHAWLDAALIRTGTLVLRAQREDDAQRILEGRDDDECRYWLAGNTTPEDLDGAVAYIRDRHDQMARGIAVYWAVADPESDLLLGSVTIRHLDDPVAAEVGYWAHPEARGRGLITEAVRLVVRHAFIDSADGGLGLTKLRLIAAVDNPPSRRVAEAAGFREVGVERAGTLCADGPHDAVIYDLLGG